MMFSLKEKTGKSHRLRPGARKRQQSNDVCNLFSSSDPFSCSSSLSAAVVAATFLVLFCFSSSATSATVFHHSVTEDAEPNASNVLDNIRIDAIALILARGMGEAHLPHSAAAASAKAFSNLGGGGAPDAAMAAVAATIRSSVAVAAAEALPPIISKQEAIDAVMGGRPLPPEVTEAEMEKLQARKFASAVALDAAAANSNASSSSPFSSPDSSRPLHGSAQKPLNVAGARPGAVGANVGFVGGAGPLMLDNKHWTLTGTNALYMSGFQLSRDEIVRQMELHASRGVNAMRVFVANDFDPNLGTQTSWGVFNERALVQMDHVFAAAAMHGIRIIPVLSNYWPFVGGIQAWVDSYVKATPGTAANQPKEAFFTNPAIRDMFKRWVRLVVTRVNTETGVAYSQDPTVLAWELMNEPHTGDGFEAQLGLTPGSIVCAWLAEMTAFIRTLDGNHLVSTGEEGYRADLTSDSSPHSWMNNGLKGGDFVCNTCRTGITLATVHLYPDAWGFTSSDYEWLGENFLADRRRAALSCGKPAIVEEYGMGSKTPATHVSPNRETLFRYLMAQASAAGYSGSLLWAVAEDTQGGGWLPGNDGPDYVFRYSEDGGASVQAEYERAKGADVASGAANIGDSFSSPAAPPPPPPPACTDVAPGGSSYTCSQHASWNQCSESWILDSGFCKQSCGRC